MTRMRFVLERRLDPFIEPMTSLEDSDNERHSTLDHAGVDGMEPSPAPHRGVNKVAKLALRVAEVLPPSLQRFMRSGRSGALALRMLDLLAPTGRYEVLEVQSGALEGAVLEVDVRKQREMIAGSYELAVQEALARYLEKGQVAYDVGAHLGFFTLLMARLVGDQGRVVALEPDPFMGTALENNLRLNRVTNVSVIKAAAGASAGKRRFSPGHGAGIGHLAEDGEVAVEGTTIDDLGAVFGSPDLIKVDVEGGELEVLKGAWTTLSSRKPALVIELHGPDNEAAATDLLGGFGYEIHYVEDEPSQRRHLVAGSPG
jgi:FkbM family methyltransferase